jgi:signal transduction histidine kinase
MMILVTVITLLSLSKLVMDMKLYPEVDTVAVNELVKLVESNWGNIKQGDYSAIQQQFVVLDNDGKVLYQSTSGLSTTLNEAMKHRDIIADLRANDMLVGKLIIHSEYQTMIQHTKQQLVKVIIVAFSALALLCLVNMIWINQTVFKPFKKLKDFAHQVARGNLDIPLKMDKSNIFGAFTESFDILREELSLARQREYTADRSKKELVASLSHDIKTPVSTIKAVSELMLLRANDEKVSKQLNTIYSKAEQINLLVTDMFHATLEELMELKVTVAEEHSSVLVGMINHINYDDQISCDPIPECLILTDATRLQQVLDNILSNSYKYAGSPIIIQSRINDGHLEVHIMDDGKGILEDELPLIFNKFYRGSNAQGKGGSGLGLYISKYLMQSMQGMIECHRREDGFTVVLKIKLA